MSEKIWCDLYEWLYWGVDYKPPEPPHCLNYVRLTPNATVDIRDMFYVPRLQWHPEDTTFISEFEFRRMKKCLGSNYHLCMINPKNITCPDRIACKIKYRELHQKKE